MAKYKTRHNSAVGVVLDVGVKRGNLTIVKEVEPLYRQRKNRPLGQYQKVRRYLCKCDCGNEIIKTEDTLKRGIRPSCGCNFAVKADILPNQKYGRLTVIKEAAPKTTPNGRKFRQFICRCDCGKEVVKSLDFLTHAENPDCGCITPSRRRYGEMGQHRLYRIWKNIISRCTCPTSPAYKDYGGRGIKMCEEWFNDFESFYAWAFTNGYSDKLSIDRIDNNGGYEPSNCRWATKEQQMNNTRANHHLTANGETHTIKEWSRLLDISFEVIYSRVNKYGWSDEEALGFVKRERKL